MPEHPAGTRRGPCDAHVASLISKQHVQLPLQDSSGKQVFGAISVLDHQIFRPRAEGQSELDDELEDEPPDELDELLLESLDDELLEDESDELDELEEDELESLEDELGVVLELLPRLSFL